MLSRLLDPRDGMPRNPAHWLVLAAIVATQLLAFYALCVHQVRDAQARQAQALVRVAQADCPKRRAQPGDASCSVRPARATQEVGPGVLATGAPYR